MPRDFPRPPSPDRERDFHQQAESQQERGKHMSGGREPPPFMFAVEAILGLTAQGKPVTEEAVKAWIATALNNDEARMGPALFLAKRMLAGPKPFPLAS